MYYSYTTTPTQFIFVYHQLIIGPELTRNLPNRISIFLFFEFDEKYTKNSTLVLIKERRRAF